MKRDTKYYYMVGLTKQKLKELGATIIIPAGFSYMHGLHPGHDLLHGEYGPTKSARNQYAELVEWAFCAEKEILLSIKFVIDTNPIEISGRHFRCLIRGEGAGINVGSKLHRPLVTLRYQYTSPIH